ncbi:MAG: hypothetical protein LBJ31_08585, partial [Treponema sp.]|nr:hypothetical protein [Treponema sp.]
MNIFIRIKAAGKRRDMLEKRPQDIPGDLKSAEEFIAALVRENVRTYNEKAVEAPFFHYLSKQ